MENAKSQVLSERLHNLISEVAKSIRPKVDEIRTGRVMGAANSEAQLAGTMVQAVIAMGLLDPELLPPVNERRHMGTLSLVKDDIPAMAREYIRRVEMERTNNLCSCEWIIHPEDVDSEPGSRRMHRGAPDLACVVHTKVGLLLGFFVHVFEPGGILGTPKMVTASEAKRRTPSEWAADEPRMIVDNDGWTIGEWNRQEPCTYDEFFARFTKCTTAERHG